MFEALKRIKNKVAVALVAAVTAVIMGANVFAESAGTANSSVTTAMTGLANDMVATGNAMIPIALTVVGIGLVVVFGVRIFKKIAKP